MKVDLELLEKLEKLSLLKIDDSKRENVISQLSDILEYVDSLNELDTSSQDSYFSTLDGGAPLREDVVNSNKDISESIIKNAPQSDDNFFVVPAIIE